MLADRHYMRDDGYRPPMSMTAKLIITLVAVFAVQCIDAVYLKTGLVDYLVLSSAGVKSGFIWQFFSFQMLHAGFLHIMINCLIIWMIGRHVDHAIGGYRFAVAFFGCGLLGGVFQAILMVAFPQMYGTNVVGASAGVGGLFAVFAMLMRDQTINMYFVLPIKAQTLLWVMLGIAAFFTLVPAGGNVAHAAHLGGLLGGIWFVKRGWHRDFQPLPWDGLLARLKSGKSGGRRKPFVVKTVAPTPAKSAKPTASKGEHPDFIASQVDPILDKISEKGLHSLTDREREILEKARNRMGKR